MSEDCDDFSHFAHRKGMLNHFTQMLEFQDGLYKGKWAVRCTINVLRILSKAAKEVASSESKLDEIKAEFEEVRQTDDYQKRAKDQDADDHDEVRSDPDPDGW